MIFEIIYGWLITSCALLLGSLGLVWFDFTLKAYKIKMDYLTYALVIYNFAVVGVISIFWRAHMKVIQFYLIMISAMTVINII